MKQQCFPLASIATLSVLDQANLIEQLFTFSSSDGWDSFLLCLGPSEPLLSFSEEIEAKLAFKNLLCGKPAARLQILQEQRRRREEPLMRKAPREPAKPKKKALPHANGNEEESPTSVKLKIREGKLTIWKGSPRVEFCGYSIPHPSENKVNIRVQTTGDSAKDVLKESFQDLILLCQHVRSTFEKSVADFKSTQSDFKSTQSHQEMNGA